MENIIGKKKEREREREMKGAARTLETGWRDGI